MSSNRRKTRKTAPKSKTDSWKAAAKFLTRDFRTARQLAEKLGVSKIHAYRIIESLPARGVQLNKVKLRVHATGPLSDAYQVAPAPTEAAPV